MKQAINTRTQEEYDALIGYYESQNVVWRNGKRPCQYNGWDRSDSCVSLSDGRLTCGLSDHYVQKGYSIIPFTEFAKANIVEEPDWKAKYENETKYLFDAMVDLAKGYRKIWDKYSGHPCITPEYIKAQRAIRLFTDEGICRTCKIQTGDLGFCPDCDTHANSR